MTYLEKYMEEHPGLSDEEYRRKVALACPHHPNGWTLSCPRHLPGYSGASLADQCRMCWNQEIPEAKPANNKANERKENTMNKNFTKADLKVGYVVKYRNGCLRMVMPYAGGLVLTTINGGMLDIDTALNDDLTYRSFIQWTHKGLDVMEVYGLNKHGSDACSISANGRELLWKREEPPKKTCDDCIHKVVCSHVGVCEHFAEKK